jgi:hypothetical protein
MLLRHQACKLNLKNRQHTAALLPHPRHVHSLPLLQIIHPSQTCVAVLLVSLVSDDELLLIGQNNGRNISDSTLTITLGAGLGHEYTGRI